MAKCGALGNLLVKEHTHTFVNAGGDVRALDFRFNVGGRKIGAPFHGLKAFFTTAQLAPIDKARAHEWLPSGVDVAGACVSSASVSHGGLLLLASSVGICVGCLSTASVPCA